MVKITLKKPLGEYPLRYDRFLHLMARVKALPPANLNLWRVMDSAAFEDAETALEVVLKESRAARKFTQANER